MTAIAPTHSRTSGSSRRVGLLQDFLARPVADFYLVLVSALLLVFMGVVMVLSSSSIYATSALGIGPYYFAIRQVFFLVVGLPVAWWVSRCQPGLIKVASWLALVGVVVLLIATVLFGSDAGKGNQAWIELGPISLQPSEFAKPVLIVWAAGVWANRRHHLEDVRALLFPVSVAFALVLGLVILEKDVGTALVLAFIMVAMLFFVGANWRVLSLIVAGGVAAFAALVLTNPNRMNRIFSFLGKDAAAGSNDQAQSAIYALATGGWFGVGLGASRQKYGSLADAAHNDFIFAVIGEELGLVGTLLVIALFFVFAFAGFRIALRSTGLFDRIVAASITAWIVGQALVNILVATNLAPVMGVPLPFLSYGGSALLASVVGVGLLLGCARREPDAAAARQARGKRPRVTTVVDAGLRSIRPRHGGQ